MYAFLVVLLQKLFSRIFLLRVDPWEERLKIVLSTRLRNPWLYTIEEHCLSLFFCLYAAPLGRCYVYVCLVSITLPHTLSLSPSLSLPDCTSTRRHHTSNSYLHGHRNLALHR